MKRPKFVLAIGLLGILEALLRLVFYYEAVFAGIPLVQPAPPAAVMSAVNSISLILGLGGLAAASGLLRMTEWGYWGIAMVSAFDIVFDGVSTATISFTAFAGLVLPVVFLVVLIPRRANYFGRLRPT